LTAFFYITGGLTALSGIHYIYGGLKLVSQQAENRQDDDG